MGNALVQRTGPVVRFPYSLPSVPRSDGNKIEVRSPCIPECTIDRRSLHKTDPASQCRVSLVYGDVLLAPWRAQQARHSTGRFTRLRRDRQAVAPAVPSPLKGLTAMFEPIQEAFLLRRNLSASRK